MTDRDRRPGPLAHELSHELRGSLSTISFCCELLRGYTDDPQVRDYADRIERALQEADGIVAGFVDFADRAVGAIDDGPVDLEDLAGEVVGDLTTEIAAVDAEVQWDELPTLRGDRALLRALLSHLVDNALRHRRAQARPRVRIDARRHDGVWQIRVEDDGPGVPVDDRERVFELFEHASNTDGTQGVGVGLAICRSIAERHGGHIWIESAGQGGSRVVVELPAGAA